VIVFAALAVAVANAGAYAQQGTTIKTLEEDYVALTNIIRPVVVNIDTKGTVSDGEDSGEMSDLFRFFGIPSPEGQETPRPKRMRMAQGSGFIYDDQGHIITNNHMVEDTSDITVKLASGKQYKATVVGRDPDTDIAVIKITPDEPLPVSRLADSDSLRVGQFAIAAGSPRGFEGSVSFGHISALGREELNLPGLRFQHFIQTDAAINLGNSGGPLCNSSGEVIGINIAIVYGANSLGFAIPINTAKQIVPTLISKGKVTRGFLGVGITNVRDYAEGVNLPDQNGAFVKTVQPGSPAEQAGVKPYDVIRKVNGAPVENASMLVRLISDIAPGETANLEVWREGKPVEVKVTLSEYSGEEVTEEAAEKSALGLHVQNITPDISEKLRIKAGTTGVIITQVEPGSAAQEAGLSEGDVITEVAQQKVNNVDDFARIVNEAAKPGRTFLMGIVRRSGQADIIPIKVPEEEKKQ
jgi:serine protease Do